MSQYLLIAIAVLTLALGGTGWLLKGQVEKAAVLSAEVDTRDKTITRLSTEIKAQAADRDRLDRLLSERDQRNRETEARATRFSDALRVARQNSPDFSRCLDQPIDPQLVGRLYDIWPGGDTDGKTVSP